MWNCGTGSYFPGLSSTNTEKQHEFQQYYEAKLKPSDNLPSHNPSNPLIINKGGRLQ